MQIYKLNEKSKYNLTLNPGADTPSYATVYNQLIIAL